MASPQQVETAPNPVNVASSLAVVKSTMTDIAARNTGMDSSRRLAMVPKLADVSSNLSDVKSTMAAMAGRLSEMGSVISDMTLKLEGMEKDLATLEEAAARPPVTFLSLPGELRNRIYDLSGCLEFWRCGYCCRIFRRDEEPPQVLEKFGADHGYCSDCISKDSPKRPGAHMTPTDFIWVNRRSCLAQEGHDQNPSSQKLRNATSNCKAKGLSAMSYAEIATNVSRLAQPALSKVSRQIRAEVLSIFYGKGDFLLTLMDRKVDRISICKWLSTMGQDSAGRLRNLNLVYRKNKDLHFIKKELLPAMKGLGVRINERMMAHQSKKANGCTKHDGDILIVKRLKAPYCYCEFCICQSLKETNSE